MATEREKDQPNKGEKTESKRTPAFELWWQRIMALTTEIGKL